MWNQEMFLICTLCFPPRVPNPLKYFGFVSLELQASAIVNRFWFPYILRLDMSLLIGIVSESLDVGIDFAY